jgi:hypothetical protein
LLFQLKFIIFTIMSKKLLPKIGARWQVIIAKDLKPLVEELCTASKVKQNMSQVVSLAVLEKHERDIGGSNV